MELGPGAGWGFLLNHALSELGATTKPPNAWERRTLRAQHCLGQRRTRAEHPPLGSATLGVQTREGTVPGSGHVRGHASL